MAHLFFGLTSTGNAGVVNFANCKYWAERGLIHIEDKRDGAYEVISVRTALQRMKGIGDMLGNSTTSREKHTFDQFDYDNIKRHQDFLDGMTRLCEQAQVQGMPTDASARRDLVRRRPKTVVVPEMAHVM